MKGAIVNCLKEMIVAKFGQPQWDEIVIASGLNPSRVIMATSDIDDAMVMTMVGNSCKVLNQNMEQITDQFGDYWMNSFAVGVYRPYYGTTANAKEFFNKLNEIHTKVTKYVPNAKPPRFEYEWKRDDQIGRAHV